MNVNTITFCRRVFCDGVSHLYMTQQLPVREKHAFRILGTTGMVMYVVPKTYVFCTTCTVMYVTISYLQLPRTGLFIVEERYLYFVRKDELLGLDSAVFVVTSHILCE